MLVLVARIVLLDFDPGMPWLALSCATLSTVVPGLPGHVGTFDWSAAWSARAYAVDPAHAVAFALCAHAALWCLSTGCACALAGLAGLVRLWSRFRACSGSAIVS